MVVRSMMRILRWVAYAAIAIAALAVLTLAYFRWQADQREVMETRDTAPRAGRHITAADVSMFVQEAGPADGQPVVFVHGTGAWSETWRESLTVLAGAGYRAIAIDLPPFGYSQRPGQPAYDKHTQGRRIVGALEALGIPGAILVGHSFGGGPT